MSIIRKIFNRARYEHDERVHNTKDANILVPYFIKLTSPQSVVDVGCGLGTFLQVFKENNVRTVVGIEGDWLDKSKSLLEPREQITANLEEPLGIQQRYDLALCLEVAEHLKVECADELVKSLTKVSDYIIFSAGIPHQGGQNHINEQWPSWWAAKFEKQGYSFYDVIRPEFWDSKNLFWWYKQNIFLVVNDGVKHAFEKQKILDMVHPDLFTFKAGKLHNIVTGNYDTLSHLKHLFLGIIKFPINLWKKIKTFL